MAITIIKKSTGGSVASPYPVIGDVGYVDTGSALVDLGSDIVSITMGANTEIAIVNGEHIGQRITLWVYSSGGDYQATMGSGIIIPSDSTFTSKTVENNKRCVFLFVWDGTGWMLSTVLGNYIPIQSP